MLREELLLKIALFEVLFDLPSYVALLFLFLIVGFCLILGGADFNVQQVLTGFVLEDIYKLLGESGLDLTSNQHFAFLEDAVAIKGGQGIEEDSGFTGD